MNVKTYSWNCKGGQKHLGMHITGALNKVQKHMVCSNKIPPPPPLEYPTAVVSGAEAAKKANAASAPTTSLIN